MIDKNDELEREIEHRTRYGGGAIKIGAWMLGVGALLLLFTMANNRAGAPDLLLVAGVIGGISVLVGFIILAGGWEYATSRTGPDVSKEHVRGTRLVKAEREKPPAASSSLGASAPAKPRSSGLVPIGDVDLPARAEPLHLLMEGATGTGKTQLLKNMVAAIRARGDTVVVVDSNYDLFNTFGRPGDIVLNPLDPRSPGWLPGNEIRDPTDWTAMASSFIGEGEGNSREWNSMGRAMFAAISRNYWNACREHTQPFDHDELRYLLTAAPGEIIEPLVQGTAAASIAGNERGLSNVRMTFYEGLKFWEFMKPGDFSIRQWVENGGIRPSIFIPYKKRNLPELKNLISAWLDQLIISACDEGEKTQRVWIIIDELSGLGEIPSLQTAVTELRKTGFRVVVGLQNYEQIAALYGREGAATLSNSLSNKVIFRATDADSAERQSRLIGERRVKVTTKGENFGRNSGSGDNGSTYTSGTSYSHSEQTERAILASEIMALPDLTALVRFAGESEVYLTKIAPYTKSKITTVTGQDADAWSWDMIR